MINRLKYLSFFAIAIAFVLASCNPSDDPTILGNSYTFEREVLGTHHFYTLNKDGSYNIINYSIPEEEDNILDVFSQFHQFLYTINRISFTSENSCKVYLIFMGSTVENEIETTYTLKDNVISVSLLNNTYLWRFDQTKNTINLCSSAFFGAPTNGAKEVLYDEKCLSVDPIEICKNYVGLGKYMANDTFGVYFVDAIYK